MPKIYIRGRRKAIGVDIDIGTDIKVSTLTLDSLQCTRRPFFCSAPHFLQAAGFNNDPGFMKRVAKEGVSRCV